LAGFGVDAGVLDCVEGAGEEGHQVVDVEVGADRADPLGADQQ
jgi:hypothetical protein